MSKHETSTTTAGAWDLRHPGLIMKDGNGEEIHEFMGMWPLKPDADLVRFTNDAEPFGTFWGPAWHLTFSEATTLLGLIRAARWFVGTSTEFGPTLYFVSQFDSSLEKYFDDFVLNGRENLEAIWGQCIGCPTGPNATARDIVQYIARGQIKTLAVYDAFPSLNNSQIEKHGRLVREDAEIPARRSPTATASSRTRSTLLERAGQALRIRASAAAIDTDVANEPQFTDVPSGWA